RQQNSAFKTPSVRLPVDVEKGSEGRLSAVFQHIHPPCVLGTSRHVVGNNVQQKAHIALLQFDLQRGELFFSPQVRVDSCGVDYIVSVCAALAAGKNRGQVEITDTKFVKIV